jgi:putative DNA primase/helicase
MPHGRPRKEKPRVVARGLVNCMTQRNNIPDAVSESSTDKGDTAAALRAAAQSYVGRGWPVLTLHNPVRLAVCSCGNAGCRSVGKHPRTRNGLKDATTDSSQINDWLTRWPASNIGIRTGRESGIVVLDVDPRHAGPTSLYRLELENGKLPETVEATSGGGGSHLFFRHAGERVKNRAAIAPGLDIRADGGYIVAVPSKHESGGLYEWRIAPDALPLAPLPDWLLRLANRGGARRAADTVRTKRRIEEGQRNVTLTSIAGSLRHSGLDETAIVAALLAYNKTSCKPPLTDAEVRSIARSVTRYPAGTGECKTAGLIKTLADAISSKEKFAQDTSGRLYYYSGGVYKPDAEVRVRQQVKAFLEEWKETRKWSSTLAEEVVEYIRIDSPSLQERPPLDILNVENGLLVTDTFRLMSHTPEFLSCVQLPVRFDEMATCPTWEKFVDGVFPRDARELAWEVMAWLMTPDTSIQKALLLLGDGENGKSVFLRAIRAFLGRNNVASESLHRLESNRFAAAQLVGKLANICSDLPSASLAGSSMFKAFTGGDYVSAEYKFKHPFSVLPFARLVFSANFLPRSNDASHAFFRRWLPVPFGRTFEPGEQIPREILDARLAGESELSGVLNRALVALRAIRSRRGLCEPQSVKNMTQEFVTLTDPIAVWLASMTGRNPSAMVTKKGLLEAYNATARREGRAVITSTALGLAIHRLLPDIGDGQRNVDGKLQWVWLGLELRCPES